MAGRRVQATDSGGHNVWLIEDREMIDATEHNSVARQYITRPVYRLEAGGQTDQTHDGRLLVVVTGECLTLS